MFLSKKKEKEKKKKKKEHNIKKELLYIGRIITQVH